MAKDDNQDRDFQNYQEDMDMDRDRQDQTGLTADDENTDERL